MAWEKLPEPRPSLSFEIVLPDGESQFYNLGPHPPRLWPEDVDLVHQLWLELGERFGAKLHHRDIMGIALRRMADDLRTDRSREVIEALAREVENHEGDDSKKDKESFMPSL